jgi:hypothetical protein
VKAIFEDDLASDQGGKKTIRVLYEPGRPRREIVGHARKLRANPTRVDEVHVGRETLGQPPSVGKTPGSRRCRRQHGYGLLQRELLAHPDPVRE